MDRRTFLAALAGGSALAAGAGYMIIQNMPYPASVGEAPTLTTLDESLDLTPVNAQGVAFDGTYYYTNDGSRAFTGSSLRKFTRNGAAYSHVATADILAELTADIKQVNSMDYYNGSLWLVASSFLTGSPDPAASWVVEVDPSDLSVIDTYALEEEAYGEGGAWKDVGDGDEFWAVFHDTKLVSRYKLIAGAMVKQAEYNLPLIPDAEGSGELNQGAQWHGNQLWTQLHNQHSATGTYVHRWTGTGFVGVGFIPALGSPDVAGQGLHWETVGEVMLFAVRGNERTRILRVAVGDPVTTTHSRIPAGDMNAGSDSRIPAGDMDAGGDIRISEETTYG